MLRSYCSGDLIHLSVEHKSWNDVLSSDICTVFQYNHRHYRAKYCGGGNWL